MHTSCSKFPDTNCIFLFGGRGRLLPVEKCESDIWEHIVDESDIWEHIVDMPRGRDVGCTAVALRESIYVMGGWNPHPCCDATIGCAC